MLKTKRRAFTLIELLVVIAIIGILATLAVVALQQARQNARDSKRVADMKQVSTALELFFNENGRYPTTDEWNSGSITSSTTGEIFMYNIPTAPSPADGDCLEASNTYAYVPQNDGASYTIDFCTGKQISDLLAGAKCLTPGGITNCGESAPPPPSWACGDLLTDTRDSYAYQTVQIGAQCWFKENLKYLPVVHSNSEFEARGTSQLPGYGVYAYDGSDVPTAKLSANYINYGVLYNWYAVDQASICPTGWHVPSDAEFLELEEFVDSGNYENWCDPIGEPGDCGGFWYNAGGYLKQIGTAYWNSPNSGATDAYDFTALPAGWRGSLADGGSLSLTDFWSSSAFDSIDSWRRHITYSGPEILRDNFRAFYGLSVRCLEN